ncbi:MAG: motility associated factor glycosyltransferase family protein [Candidatus Nitrohelix vancouverensis]|uniref:Motility associated factor glycosyltransferase family protein n=1 Tax=Candidatus Nitrohelix vancouverensis TaxID=2705534 RepID=A0A7T0C3N2_9BACT|nr:MAG: motility associated factor glycosyltransferase family protein [Candidatus Nitrohelix vancouverensis]
MTSVVWTENLKCLTRHRPELARLLARLATASPYRSVPARSGAPTLALQLPSGEQKFLLSAYDPEREACKSTDTAIKSGADHFIIMGLELAYGLRRLCANAPKGNRILVFEHDPELFRLALQTSDLCAELANPNIDFFIAPNLEARDLLPEDLALEFSLHGYHALTTHSLTALHADAQIKLESRLRKQLQESKVNLGTRSAFSKIFYKNIFQNWKHIRSSSGINQIENAFKDQPAIIVSAGPSLDKNINYLKQAENRALIIAVATALKPLLSRGIEPDFVIAVDPAPLLLKFFQQAPIPKKPWLVFDPATFPGVIDNYPGKMMSFDSNIELSKWLVNLTESKGSLGNMHSVSHAAFALAQHIGCNPIALIGQDLAFDGHRQHCSYSAYHSEHIDNFTEKGVVKQFEQNRFNRFQGTTLSAVDLFGGSTATLTNLDTYKHQFIPSQPDKISCFNATEGGAPIPDMRDTTLREFINNYCRETICDSKNEWKENNANESAETTTSQIGIQAEIDKLSKLAAILKDFGLKFEQKDFVKSDEKKRFSYEMENFYKMMLEDISMMKLLQEYAFADFVEWKTSTQAINKSADQNGTVERLFERDRKFFPVLKNAIQYMLEELEKISNSG